MNAVTTWAKTQSARWVFTLTNAGSLYFEDRNDLACLKEINWTAVHALSWKEHKEGKQAEFLIEQCFPWNLVERIGVQSEVIYNHVVNALPVNGHRPKVEIKPEWYY